MYGARLELVICEDKPKLYRLDKNNKFVFVKDLQMQEKGKINATGGTQKFWEEKHAKFIKKLFDEGYRLRYSGAMVSDINQICSKVVDFLAIQQLVMRLRVNCALFLKYFL